MSAGGTLKYRNLQNNNNSPTFGPVICKEEVVGDVICGSTGQTIIVPVHTFQPGMVTMFSWAAGQSAGYQRYRVRRAAYRFAPYVGVFSDQGKNGKLILYFSYDVNSPLPLDAATAENSKPSLSKMITEWKTNNVLILDPAYMQDGAARNKLIRTVDPADNYALRDFDAGKLILVTTDFTTSGKVGTIYVDYELELLIPQPVPDTRAFEITRTLDKFDISYSAAEATSQLRVSSSVARRASGSPTLSTQATPRWTAPGFLPLPVAFTLSPASFKLVIPPTPLTVSLAGRPFSP